MLGDKTTSNRDISLCVNCQPRTMSASQLKGEKKYPFKYPLHNKQVDSKSKALN